MIVSPFDWLQVGHWTDAVARTGVTVLRFDQPTVASGEVRGGAPATREFALLDPSRTVERVDAIVISGGSAFGLAAADGVMTQLESEGVGFETKFGVVPIVVAMSLYDLGVGNPNVRPGPAEGRAALISAATSFGTGAVGAGAGATIGKWRGPEHARDAGIGWAEVRRDELVVAALVAVNAAGDVAGEPEAIGTIEAIADGSIQWPRAAELLGGNTTIGAIITNGRFTKTQCQLLAQAGHDGLARALVPAHTPTDGDAFVAITNTAVEADLATARLMAAAAVEHAIRNSLPGDAGSLD